MPVQQRGAEDCEGTEKVCTSVNLSLSWYRQRRLVLAFGIPVVIPGLGIGLHSVFYSVLHHALLDSNCSVLICIHIFDESLVTTREQSALGSAERCKFPPQEVSRLDEIRLTSRRARCAVSLLMHITRLETTLAPNHGKVAG